MSSEPVSVLAVDDDADVREMLELLLAQWGYRPTTAATATDGLRLLFERRFDLVILDNWLPDLDGIEICRQIRGSDTATPIIFYSAAGMGSEQREAMQAGATSYVLKGAGPSALHDAITHALTRAGRA